MRRSPSFPLLLAALAVLLASVVTALPASSAADERRAPSLSVSPANGTFTAGQELTFTGNIGRSGRQKVRLQSNMGRPGDAWKPVPGASSKTNASGAFTIRTQAWAMLGIKFRVAGKGARTPAWTSQVVHQEVDLISASDDLGSGAAVVGRPVRIVADTSRMPLLLGRGTTLQQRSGTGWVDVAPGVVGADGRSEFAVTPATAGTTVYRVRLEAFRQGIGYVGWFPSYPLYVEARGSAEEWWNARSQRPSTQPRVSADPVAPRLLKPFQTTAAATLKWGTQQFDFDWEQGHSLTDAPAGLVRRGSWLDESDGTGRTALRNGALHMSSNSEGAGRSGSRGSMWATLNGNAQAYGRWETRMMPMLFGGGTNDYTVSFDLVPADPAARRCGAQDITLLQVRPRTSEVLVGARNLAGTQWTRRIGGVQLVNTFHAFAVEVDRKKITWFIDGRPVGQVRDRSAISGLPLTVRVSMTGGEDMKTTRVLWDWIRGYPMGRGAKTPKAPHLSRGTHTLTC